MLPAKVSELRAKATVIPDCPNVCVSPDSRLLHLPCLPDLALLPLAEQERPKMLVYEARGLNSFEKRISPIACVKHWAPSGNVAFQTPAELARD